MLGEPHFSLYGVVDLKQLHMPNHHLVLKTPLPAFFPSISFPSSPSPHTLLILILLRHPHAHPLTANPTHSLTHPPCDPQPPFPSFSSPRSSPSPSPTPALDLDPSFPPSCHAVTPRVAQGLNPHDHRTTCLRLRAPSLLPSPSRPAQSARLSSSSRVRARA